MKKAFLLFSGYNQRAVIAFCREATRLNVPFYIVAKSKEDSIFLSSYKEHVLAIRREKALVMEDVDHCFNQVKSMVDAHTFVILPSSEFLNRFFLQHRVYYQEQSFTIPLVEAPLYAKISDKESFGLLCKRYKLDIPKEISIDDPKAYPFVAKPKAYFSGGTLKTPSPYLIYTEDDWLDFTAAENSEDFYFQEYVTGISIYLLYYISTKGHSVFFSQENLVQQAKGKSIILAKSATVHLESIADDYANMLINEGFAGLIMIELKQQNDRFCMIEANPRLWGPSQLFVDAKAPIFEAFIQDLGFNIAIDPSKIKESVYFWHGGIAEDQRNGNALAFHNFTPEKLEAQMDTLLAKEIYLREDTQNIYYKELIELC